MNGKTQREKSEKRKRVHDLGYLMNESIERKVHEISISNWHKVIRHTHPPICCLRRWGLRFVSNIITLSINMSHQINLFCVQLCSSSTAVDSPRNFIFSIIEDVKTYIQSVLIHILFQLHIHERCNVLQCKKIYIYLYVFLNYDSA